MNTSCSWQRLGLMIVLAGAVGCHQSAPQPKYTIVGSRSTVDNFALSAGHLVVRPGQPGITFGTVRKPNSTEQLLYVIVFKLPPTTNESSFNTDSRLETYGDGANLKQIYAINGKRIETMAQFEMNKERTAFAKETLKMGGKEVDPAAGWLFMLDLTAAAPVYQQKKVTMPGDLPRLQDLGEVERYAEVLLKHLQEKEPDLKDWFK